MFQAIDMMGPGPTPDWFTIWILDYENVGIDELNTKPR